MGYIEETEITEIEETTPERRTLKNRKRPEDKFIVSVEVAEDQIVGWLDFYQIYPEEIPVENERVLAEATIDKLVIFIRQGMVEFRDDGTCMQILQSGTKVDYKRLEGSAKTQNRERKNEAQDSLMTRRQYSIMGSLSGLGTNAIAKFHPLDMSIAECISFLLSSV